MVCSIASPTVTRANFPPFPNPEGSSQEPSLAPPRSSPAPRAGHDPPLPELSVAARPQLWYLRNPSLHHCERSGLGYERPTPRSGRPRPGPSPPRPRDPGPASPPLDARAIGCRPGPSCSTSATPVSNPASLGLGPRAARPALKTPLVGSPAPSPALPLTPEQQARLAAMPVASRDQVLLWLATGDPILVAEARKKLAPLRPLLRHRGRCPSCWGGSRENPSYPALAAAGLAAALDDPKSYNGFLARCREAWHGLIPVPVLQDAYRQATGPKVRNPGAIFQVACQRRE